MDTSPTSQNIKWLSLSYCWGGEPSIKLTMDTMDRLKNGIPLDSLDHTIRDAILVTRALEIPYIWIDAMYIVQDPEGDEWDEQAPRMNEIYRGSMATLVAASPSTAKDGFLKERQSQYVQMPWFTPPGENAADADIADASLQREYYCRQNGPRTKALSRDPGPAEDGRCKKACFPVACYTTHLLKSFGSAAKRKNSKETSPKMSPRDCSKALGTSDISQI